MDHRPPNAARTTSPSACGASNVVALESQSCASDQERSGTHADGGAGKISQAVEMAASTKGPKSLAGLPARIEAARGPDQQLDRAIAIALAGGNVMVGGQCEAYTGSLDAALGLMELVLPGWELEACRYVGSDARVEIWPQGLRPELSYDSRGATLGLALMAAVVKALVADQQR